MLPNNKWSSSPVVAGLLYPRDSKESLLSASDYGPVAIQNTSQGLSTKVWKATYDTASGAVRLHDGSLLFVEKDIKELDLTFNQTANPFVAYRVGANIKIYWYDTTTSSYTNKTIGLGDQPFCYLDERRPEFSSKSDVILIYHRDGTVYRYSYRGPSSRKPSQHRPGLLRPALRYRGIRGDLLETEGYRQSSLRSDHRQSMSGRQDSRPENYRC